MALKTAPYYCSVDDVKTATSGMATSWAAADAFTFISPAISRAYSEINAAASQGGYTIPLTLTVQTLVSSAAILRADSQVDITIDTTTYTNADFPVSSTVRINGVDTSESVYQEEFVPIVDVSSTNVISVQWLKNGYAVTTTTIELCTEGFLHARNCNILGAASYALKSKNIKRDTVDGNVTDFADQFDACLEALRSGDIRLDGLTAGGDFIESLQTENEDQMSPFRPFHDLPP